LPCLVCMTHTLTPKLLSRISRSIDGHAPTFGLLLAARYLEESDPLFLALRRKASSSIGHSRAKIVPQGIISMQARTKLRGNRDERRGLIASERVRTKIDLSRIPTKLRQHQ
jgi:hypothetical protein